MNLRQMEVFRAVMLTGTLAGAAELLHVSQPTVSKALALGERRAGLRLFERLKGRLLPTPEGRRLFEQVEQLWSGVEKIRALSAELASPTSGRLHVVASPSLGSAVVPAAVVALRAGMPELEAKVDLLVPHLLQDAVADQTADVGLALFPVGHPNLATVERYECGWVCVMPKGHALARKASVSPADLVGYPLISFSQQTAYGVPPEAVFGPTLAKLRFGVQVRAGQSACLFSVAGAGLAIVDELTVVNDTFPQLEVRPFRTRHKLAVQVVRNVHRPLSIVAQRFCEVLDRQLGGR